MCQYCRTPDDHRPEACPTLKLLFDDNTEILDGIKERSKSGEAESDPEADETEPKTCSRSRCHNPALPGHKLCAKHYHDVVNKRKLRASARVAASRKHRKAEAV